MKGIQTILVLLLVSAGALALTGGVEEAYAGDVPDGALVTLDSGRTDDLNQDTSGDPTDAGDGNQDPRGDGPPDDGLPSEFELAGDSILEGLLDLLMTALPLLP